MQINFPYGDIFDPVDVCDEKLLGVFQPKSFDPVDSIQNCVERSILNPIGSPDLFDMARGRRSCVIISDDNTRQTPVSMIIPVLENILKEAGIDDISILIALGTHRPMSDQEILCKFGSDIQQKIPVCQHNFRDPDMLIDMGKSKTGIPLQVNRMVVEADLVIGLGQIVPHRIAGFSGGSKIILPGVCGPDTIAITHWQGSVADGKKMLGFEENPIRESMDYLASLSGLNFIINAVCDPAGRLIDCFSGDYIAAHREGCKLSRRVFGVEIPQTAKIVITDSFPKDIELWQAAKALYASDLVVEPGGVVILVSPCTEGVSRSHPQILERGYTTENITMQDVETGRLKSLSAAAHCLRVGRLIKDKATGIMVKNGISRAEIEHLGFLYAATPQQALDMAFNITGSDAKVAVLKNGGEALPVMGCISGTT